jgi:hypothetical protein
MKGGAIFIVFFIFFTSATLAVPVPLFPGNLVRFAYKAMSIPSSLYTPLIDAMVNGAVYGFIVWVMFVLVSKKLEEPEVVIDSQEKRKHKKRYKPS